MLQADDLFIARFVKKIERFWFQVIRWSRNHSSWSLQISPDQSQRCQPWRRKKRRKQISVWKYFTTPGGFTVISGCFSLSRSARWSDVSVWYNRNFHPAGLCFPSIYYLRDISTKINIWWNHGGSCTSSFLNTYKDNLKINPIILEVHVSVTLFLDIERISLCVSPLARTLKRCYFFMFLRSFLQQKANQLFTSLSSIYSNIKFCIVCCRHFYVVGLLACLLREFSVEMEFLLGLDRQCSNDSKQVRGETTKIFVSTYIYWDIFFIDTNIILYICVMWTYTQHKCQEQE